MLAVGLVAMDVHPEVMQKLVGQSSFLIPNVKESPWEPPVRWLAPCTVRLSSASGSSEEQEGAAHTTDQGRLILTLRATTPGALAIAPQGHSDVRDQTQEASA